MKDASYWISLAHLPKWGQQKTNNLIIQFYHENKLTIEDFFHLREEDWKKDYGLSDNQVFDLQKAKADLPNNAFLAEALLNQGYEIIPITSSEYSKTLKSNLKAAHSPVVLYIKGNKKILEEDSVAIVGSRDAADVSLRFTDNIAKNASRDFKVIVSGFAKGVDKQALDSAIKYNGQSIIVLPQGIMTFESGFKNYYKQIIDGNVLVLSTFFPKAPWRVELAMARNPIIYGLATEIYVAESSDKGGTWSGVVDGLRKGRKIFVRNPDINEKNANLLLIRRGAVSVDFDGCVLPQNYGANIESPMLVVNDTAGSDLIDKKIIDLLRIRPLNAKELLVELSLNWSGQKLSKYLKTLDFISVTKVKNSTTYSIKDDSTPKQLTFFS